MPARSSILVLMLFVTLSLSPLILSPRNGQLSVASTLAQPSSSLNSALAWLIADEDPNGSYGDYHEFYTAAAAYALWLNDSTSQSSTLAYSYLIQQLNDNSTWFWDHKYGEADIPGEVLFSISITHNLGEVNSSTVKSNLLYFQESSFQTTNGGFDGYQETINGNYRRVASSVDTAMAIWGLSNAGLIPEANRTAAANYLLTLQNPDGSFPLTQNTAADPVYSLGPDKTANTALAVLALRDNGFNANSSPISASLNFLSSASSTGFGGPGHVYAAALSVIAFLECYRPQEAASVLAYLSSQQNQDGGFSDSSRSSSSSNALDTGWAAVALQYAIRQEVTIQGPVNQSPKAIFSFSPQNPKNGTSVSFDAGSSYDSDGDHLQYDWTFGDGNTASGQKVTHSYSQSGTYTVTLTITDSGTNPNQLTGTTWNSITVGSSSIAQTSNQPQTNNLNLEAGIAVLGAVIIIGAYLVIRANRKRTVRK